ncbi:MAG: cytochrome-c peroxidase [Lewinellaceae bacterium]|nr:cytochrome C peroxidase [Phaeodactylibacter sp.]MCB9040753.1 cytochrome-c peroxidase [Lewinellaceae bacterium]
MKNAFYLFRWPVLGLLAVLVACETSREPAPEMAAPVLPESFYNYSNVEMPFAVADDFTNGGVVVDHQGLINFVAPPFGSGNAFELQNVTDAGATLGRVLFYDRQLSINNSVACGSCHRQESAFADGKKGSEGFGGKVTPRNSMGIVNVALNNNLFWDSRIASLREMVIKPVQNHIEMGMESMEVLSQKLAKSSYYPPLFEAAFGTPQVTEDRIAQALTQFLSSMITANSKFDHAQENNFAAFSELEKMGMSLFQSERAKCSSCHSGPNFSAPDGPGDPYGGSDIKGTANIGLDLVYQDQGKGDGQFKIPSLRNIALTAPYMHDGRFNTLEEVVEHYNSGIQAHAKLDPKLIGPDGNPQRLNLDAMEKAALVAFLKTLTDEQLVQDPRFSDPFR